MNLPQKKVIDASLLTEFRSHQSRLNREAEKRATVLAWVASEGYSTTEILQKLLNLSRPQTYQTMKKLERDGLVTLQTVERGLLGKNTVWFVTQHGATLAMDPNAERIDIFTFQPGRVSPLTLNHVIDCQRARLAAQAAGWKNWITDKQCRTRAALDEPAKEKRVKWLKIPDAIASDPDGVIVAIEIERTPKKPSTYAETLAEYVQMMHSNVIHRVDYVFPDPLLVPRVARIFKEIKSIKIQGQDVPITPAILSRFRFTALANWPQK